METKRTGLTGLVLGLAIALVLALAPQLSLTARAAEDTFALGSFDATSETFKDASGTGDHSYKTLMIAYGRMPESTEQLTLPTVDGFVENTAASTQSSKVITMEGGKTLEQIADYVKQIVFKDSKILGQDVQITITDEVVSNELFYYTGTGHYYQYVATTAPVTWTQAYDAAKNSTFAGRQGYLITITTKEEDQFVQHASNKVSWLGGTIAKPGNKSGQYYDSFSNSSSSSDTLDHWYWACGPEIDTGFYDRQGSGHNYTAQQNKWKQYINWHTGGEPTWGSECYLVTQPNGNGYSTGSGYAWNDWPPAATTGGYFVEFGDRGAADGWGDSGNNSSADDTTVVASGKIPAASHTHTFVYSADGATVTATCSAQKGCDLEGNKAKLTIEAPTLTTYGGEGEAKATLADLDAFNTATEKSVAATDIKYVGRGETAYEESATAPTAAGTYTAKITVEGATATVDYEIAKAPLTITAKDQTIAVGDAIPDLSSPVLDTHYTVEGLVGEDKLAAAPKLAYQSEGQPADPDSTAPGTYDIVPSEASADDNYAISYVSGKLTINKAVAVPAKVSASDRTYDGTEKPLATASGEAAGGEMRYALGADAETAPEASAYGADVPTAPNAGTYYVWYKAVATDDAHLDSEPACVEATVAKAKVTVTADAAAKRAGEADPELTASVSGRPEAGAEVAYSLSREAGEAVGTYKISVAVGDNPNYEVTAVDGTLTISQNDMSKLAEAAKAAQATLDATVPSADGTDVPVGKKWATPAARVALKKAIASAKAVLDDPNATQAQIDDAVKALAAAKAAFDAATNDGTKKDDPAPDPAPTKATLTFDLAGGTLDGRTGTISVEATVGETVTLPAAPTREGYSFRCWRGSEYAAGARYKVEGDHAFTAEWQKTSGQPDKESGQASRTDSASKGTSLPRTGDAALPAAAVATLGAAACFLGLGRRRR